MKVLHDSSFFKERRASALPTPAEIRAINRKSGRRRATTFDRPPPVAIPSLGLLVKYGGRVTAVEAETQMKVREQLQGQVPIPEIYGWTEDEGQIFIYMSFVPGSTLEERWRDLDEGQREAICKELNDMVKAWRALEQDKHDHYIGSIGKKPLNEIFLESHPNLAGPFEGANAVQRFQDGCGIRVQAKAPIVFTHDDLLPPNILLTPGPNPRVAAIIDWAQAGWYPAYWEYCKARAVSLDPKYFDDAAQEEWYSKYLPKIVDREDDETCYYPYYFFVMSKGI